MVVAVDRRAGDLVANEENHRFEEVGKPTPRCFARPQRCCQAREQQEQNAGEHQFQDHVFRNPESRLHRIEAVERRERLRDQNLSVHCVVELGDIGDVGAAVPQELWNVVELLPSLPPQRLRHLEEVAVFQVVDRIVVGHRGQSSSAAVAVLVRQVFLDGTQSVDEKGSFRQSGEFLPRIPRSSRSPMMCRRISVARSAR